MIKDDARRRLFDEFGMRGLAAGFRAADERAALLFARRADPLVGDGLAAVDVAPGETRVLTLRRRRSAACYGCAGGGRIQGECFGCRGTGIAGVAPYACGNKSCRTRPAWWCGDCSGSGVIHEPVPCSVCEGLRELSLRCAVCLGEGALETVREGTVRIPDIPDGQLIRVMGGTTQGNLYLYRRAPSVERPGRRSS